MTEPIKPKPDAEETLRRLNNRIDRERNARKKAESLLEEKSLELYKSNKVLIDLSTNLENRVAERTNQLNNALNQAQSANAAKSRFLALMSHEIRTPLNGVLGLTELMRTTILDKQQSLYINNILIAGNNLMHVINDILDYSKVEAGEMTLEMLVFNPLNVVREAVDLMRVQAEAKQLKIELNILEIIPSKIYADPTRLRQVLFNLIGNAIKFTEQGTVSVSLSSGDGKLSCSVRDSGIGMSQSTLELLFEPFRQADPSTSRKYGGTGLGLMITRALIEKMQGQVHVSSTFGQGSCFSFDLPLIDVPDMGQSVIEAGYVSVNVPSLTDFIEQPNISSLRILLVDDHPINLLMARSQLNKIGCVFVEEAVNGLQALQCLRTQQFDLVLMDMQMPEMDGLDATRALRMLDLEVQPVVIAMTANAFAEDMKICKNAGMNHFIAKPVKLETLRAVLLKVLSNSINNQSTQMSA